MKHTQLLLSTGALIFGLVILGTSLAAISTSQSTDDQARATQRRLYFDQEILPDHVFYPAMMVADRVKLESSQDFEKVALELEFGYRRMDMGIKLLKRDQSEMGVSTLTKSARYFQKASFEAQALSAPQEVTQQILSAFESYEREIKLNMELVDESDRTYLEKLLEENRAISSSLL